MPVFAAKPAPTKIADELCVSFGSIAASRERLLTTQNGHWECLSVITFKNIDSFDITKRLNECWV